MITIVCFHLFIAFVQPFSFMLESFPDQKQSTSRFGLESSYESPGIDFSNILLETYGSDANPATSPDSDHTLLVACNEETKEEDPERSYSFDRANGNFHADAETKRFDTYKSLDELKAALSSGVDYEIKSEDRKSKVTVVSPHGGFIEPGSSELSRAIAGDNYNLFDFRGLDSSDSYKAHVTSTNFRDPSLTDMLNRSKTCVSIHGMRGADKMVFVGGKNEALRDLVADKLKAAGFPVNANPPRFRGTSKSNFVNLPSENGVQLELSWGLRKQLMDGVNDQTAQPKTKFDTFSNCVRTAIQEYLDKPERKLN